MLTVNIHEAKIHLSRLVDLAARGEAFAKAGRRMVEVVPLSDEEPSSPRPLGFMKGNRIPLLRD